jgi:eukaryotic-like serine/threonine-protein kinase
MQPAVSSAQVFKFGLFEADVARNTLTRNGARIKIQDQPFRVLLLLLERPGEIVAREELRLKLWPEGTYVDFDGSLNVILKKLRAAIDDDSDNPRFIETVPRRGYRFIAPVIANGDRADSKAVPLAQDLLAVAQLQHPPPVSRPAVQWPQPRHLIYASLGLALLILIGAAWFEWHRYQSAKNLVSSDAKPSIPIRKSVAVLGFHNISGRGDDAWLATAFGEMLSTELSGGEKLRLVSGEEVAHLRLTSPWSQTDTLDQETTARIGATLNSDLLVLGSYTTIGKPDRGHLRLDVRLQDAKTGEILAEIAEIGGTQDLFQMISRVGGKLRDRMGVPLLEDSDQAGVLAALPLDPEAAKFYALGVSKLRQFDVLAAKDLLEQATKAEPRFSLGHAMLARSWSQLGYEQKRREEAKRALDLSTDLPRSDRMLVEAEYYESLGNQEQAASIYHALFELFPDDVDYGLHFAIAQNTAGHNSQALEVLQRLRNLPLPASADPRIDLVESRAIKGSKPAALVLVRSAITKATAQGKKLIYAQARKEECMILEYGDRPDQSGPACEEAYEVYVAAGNRAGAADAIRLIADYIGYEGHYEQAIATYQRALNVLDGTGEHQKTGAILNNMAVDLADEGKLDRAEQLYRQAKFHFEQAGDKNNTAVSLSNIADILYLKGNLPAAAKMYLQTLDFTATLDNGDPSYALYRLADLELAQGKVQDAERLAQQAVDFMRPAHSGYQYLTGAMSIVGEALKAGGDLQGARRQFQEGLDIRQKVGGMAMVEESQVELADLSLEEGRAEQAEPLLRSAIAVFEKEQGDPDAASAYIVLSHALLMQGKVDEARKAVQRATQLSLTSSDPALKLPAAIQSARVEMSTANGKGSVVAARQELRSTVATAKKLGYYGLECEARLALAELDQRANPAASRVQLAALALETRGHGLELLARHAEQTAAASGNVVAVNKPAK